MQGFTALGTVTSGVPYQKKWTGTEVRAWVLDAEYQSTRLVPIRPLIANLGFISNPKYWGMAFRRSFFALDAQDFALLETAMKQVQA